MGYGAPLTGFSANAAAAETLFPPYNSVGIDYSFPKSTVAPTAAVMKSDSGITYNLPIPRKRVRDPSTVNRFLSYPSPAHYSQKNCGCFYFLGEDISIQIQQQQSDVDRLISQHMEKVRMEVEEKRKREGRRILEAIEVGMMKILRKKDEEMEKMGKLNWELEERVKCLCMENEIWRDVAQTNEATANALRSNLEQVLMSQVKSEDDPITTSALPPPPAVADDAESCCGSNNDGGDEEIIRRETTEDMDGKNLEEEEVDEESEEMTMKKRKRKRKGNDETGHQDRRYCKKCWKQESCVLLLPCRHLCLCTLCASSLHTCPICNSTNNASVRVIMP